MRVSVSLEQPVGEIADAVSHAARVFEIIGIDYCCRRERSLRDAAIAAGLQADEILDLLKRPSPLPALPAIADARRAPLPELTRFIVGHHHRRARSMLVNLTLLAAEVASAHAANLPEAWPLQDHIQRIARELIPHMRREEHYLFPYIDSIERPMGPDETIVVPLFGTVAYPLQSIHHDHAEDLAIVAGIRELTHNFRPAPAACERARSLYSQLETFERELQEHIHIENDGLFPRAIAGERSAAERARR